MEGSGILTSVLFFLSGGFIGFWLSGKAVAYRIAGLKQNVALSAERANYFQELVYLRDEALKACRSQLERDGLPIPSVPLYPRTGGDGDVIYSGTNQEER